MILEWLHSRITPAQRHIRSLGLVYEAVAIEARFRRCADAWENHLESSKEQILFAVQDVEPGGEVIILGSGGLHDVPLAQLSEHFERVRLWDVVHLRQARRAAAAFPNVVCETIDVTGLCLNFSQWLKGNRPVPPTPCPPIDLPTGDANLIISLNLLSQLPLQMVARAQAPRHKVALGDFSDDVIRAHLDWLRRQSCPVLLITDLERHHAKGNIREVEEALPQDGLDLGTPLATWDWSVAPEGETPTFDTIVHKVGAFALNWKQDPSRPEWN